MSRPDHKPSGVMLQHLKQTVPQHISTVSTSSGGFAYELSYDKHGLCVCTGGLLRIVSSVGECSKCHRLVLASVRPHVLEEAKKKRPIEWVETTYGWEPR